MLFWQPHDQLVNLKVKADTQLLLLCLCEVADVELVLVALAALDVLLAQDLGVVNFEVAEGWLSDFLVLEDV